MAIDQRVVEIADAAVGRVTPSRDDIAYLLRFDGYSPEAYYVAARAREIALVTSSGIGTIHAQIGVDAHPCPMNCQYCAFAEVNAGVCEDEAELPIEEIVRAAKIFDEGNVHLISLMSTAALPFARYLEMVEAVRAAIGDDMPILANTRDMSVQEARALRAAGANAAYHAVRLQEGTFTAISPDARRRTIANIREAGLALMTGVEPVWEAADPDMVAASVLEVASFGAYSVGACGLHATKGTVLAEKGLRAPRTGFVRYVGAIVRLTCGYGVRFGGVGGSFWVDAGADPRKRQYGDAREMLIRDIRRGRGMLESDGWTVPERPSMAWFEPVDG